VSRITKRKRVCECATDLIVDWEPEGECRDAIEAQDRPLTWRDPADQRPVDKRLDHPQAADRRPVRNRE
jgi:hypothetical protein